MDLKIIRNKLIGNDQERAVSPVIGVILMVAITVILAAVIAAFVLDMGPSGADPTAAVGINGDGTTEIEVTLESSDANTDGIAIATSETSTIVSNGVLTVNGDTQTLEVTAELTADTDYNVYAYSGDLTAGSSSPEDADSIAIVEEFTTGS